MYNSNYVVTIRQNGQTVKEVDGKVILPFNSEYEIRLRNKNRKRALVDVYIDGRLTNKGGIILDVNDHIDLERFIDGNLSSGERFKLVPLSDNRVDDKNEPSNGEIEVVFYPEITHQPFMEKYVYVNRHIVHSCYPSQCLKCGRYHCSCQYCSPINMQPYYSNNPIVYCNTAMKGMSSNAVSSGGTSNNTSDSGTYNCNTNVLRSANLASSGEPGATVGGSISHQSFSRGYIDADKSKPTRIRIKLAGIHTEYEKVSTHKDQLYCSICGCQAQRNDVYCSRCGKKLRK